MSAPAVEDLSEADQVFKHLMTRFMDMGFAPQDAEILAGKGIDWHYVKERLLERGCSHDSAFLILT
jgi:hypothetical protein